jgi:adenylate kinase family enzyme
MKKISIIGSGGAGKSTLAQKLGEITDIPVFHLDSLFWKPGWVESEGENWKNIQIKICKNDSWIMDGNYGGTMDIRFKFSDTIIFLDYNRCLCLYRAIMRSIKYYGKTRPDMAKGCKEQFDLSFAKWIWEFSSTKKPTILKRLNHMSSEKTIIILNNDKDTKSFLYNLVQSMN